MPRDERSSRTSPCPHCARELPTRILADPVTLVVVGVCPEHGTAELSRVRLVVAELTEAAGTSEAQAFDPYPADPLAPVVERPLASVAYRAGSTCGLHLGAGRACSLPAGHAEPHAD